MGMTTADELRWYTSQDVRGHFVRTNWPTAVLDQGCRVQSSVTQREPSESQVDAAGRLRDIETRLRALADGGLSAEHPAHDRVLRAAYRSDRAIHGPRSLVGVDLDRALERLDPRADVREYLPLAECALLSPIAAAAWLRSESRHRPEVWLAALAKRVRKGLDQDGADRAVLARIVADARAMLEAALAAYEALRRGREVESVRGGAGWTRSDGGPARRSVRPAEPLRHRTRIRTRAWLTIREAAAVLARSRRRVAELYEEGRFPTTRRNGRGATAVVLLADHCVLAAKDGRVCECEQAEVGL